MADTLLLNADAQPVSYLPLSTLTWQDSIKYMVLEKARVLEWHEDWVVRSANWSTPVPAVMMLTEYMKTKTTVRFSKSNVFLRDNYTCQYCQKDLEKKECTLDHVLPISLGGKTVWENSVTACGPCNARKANTTKMRPIMKPYKPDFYELVNKRKRLPYNIRHESWLPYVS
jgi:5-methylcytosine-specific restriction endonuclease McrA